MYRIVSYAYKHYKTMPPTASPTSRQRLAYNHCYWQTDQLLVVSITVLLTHTLGIHNLIVLSRDADATKWPDGEKHTDITASYNKIKKSFPSHMNKQDDAHLCFSNFQLITSLLYENKDTQQMYRVVSLLLNSFYCVYLRRDVQAELVLLHNEMVYSPREQLL